MVRLRGDSSFGSKFSFLLLLTSFSDLDLEDLRVEKTLRVQRDVEKDAFLFKVRLPHQPPTKHGILSTVSSLYVPMEFACPFVLETRKILQKLRKLNLGLDDEISLYLFSDASEDGFGMCAILRLVYASGTVDVRFWLEGRGGRFPFTSLSCKQPHYQ